MGKIGTSSSEKMGELGCLTHAHKCNERQNYMQNLMELLQVTIVFNIWCTEFASSEITHAQPFTYLIHTTIRGTIAIAF